MFFRKLKKVLLYGSSFKLRPYEQTALDAWRGRLSTGAKALLTAQMQHLVSYQRQAGGKLLCFFSLEHKPYGNVPEDALFPCKLGECIVSRIHLAGSDKAGTRNNIRAEIVLHKGRISFIEFNKPPQKMLEQGVEVAKVEILRDPMTPASAEAVVDAKQREEIWTSIQSKLPDEYLHLVGESKEALINQWAVCSVQEIRKIPQRDGSYYLLAEREGMGAVGVKEDDSSGQLYYLDNGDDRGEKITVSFRTFLEEFDGGKVAGRF